MEKYPENQMYAISPCGITSSVVGIFPGIARKSLDGKFIVWNYSQKSSTLDKFKKYANVKLLSYSDVVNLMISEKWMQKLLSP